MKVWTLLGVSLALAVAVPAGCSRENAGGYSGPTRRMIPQQGRGGGPGSSGIANGTGTERPNPLYFSRSGVNPDSAQRYPQLSQQQPSQGIGAWELGTLPRGGGPPSVDPSPPDSTLQPGQLPAQ